MSPEAIADIKKHLFDPEREDRLIRSWATRQNIQMIFKDPMAILRLRGGLFGLLESSIQEQAPGDGRWIYDDPEIIEFIDRILDLTAVEIARSRT